MEHPRTNPQNNAPPGARRMELRYRDCCGALRVVPADARDTTCRRCARALRWLFREVPDAAPGEF